MTLPSAVETPARVSSSRTRSSVSWAIRLTFSQSAWKRGLSRSRLTASSAGVRSEPAIGAASPARFGGRRSSSRPSMSPYS